MARNHLSEMESSADETSTRDADGKGLDISRILLIGAAVGIAAFAVKQLPDLRRYLKMRSM